MVIGKMTAQTESWFKKLGTDALVLGAVTVLGYAVAYLFELGVSRHFGYPRYLIEPTTSVLASSLVLLAIFVFGFIPLFVLSYDNDIPLGARFNGISDWLLFVALFVCWGLIIAIGRLSWETAAIGVAFAIAYSIFLWLEFSYLKNLKALARIQYKKRVVLLAVALMDVSVGAFTAGAMTAGVQERFAFLKSDPSYAVVRIYSGTMIAMKYDSDKKRFADEYRLIKLGDDKAGMDFIIRRLTEKRPFTAD